MPIAKVFYCQSINLSQAQCQSLAAKIEVMLLEGMHAAKGITGEVLFIPAQYIHFGKKLYIEVECRQEKYYVAEELNQLAVKLEATVQQALNIQDECKVRILAFDNDRIYWAY
jgi:hypothetical protein